MRVTNNMIYSNSLYNMQSSLGALMESNIQGGTQKQINRPSDDPAGTALVLNTRANIAATEQYESNVDTARGWLELTDATLQQTSTTIAAIKTLTEQAATQTMSAENREQIAFQIEQLFGQLLNLSNTEFEGKSLFAGHKYDESAFDQVLGVTSKDDNLDTSTITVSGASDKTMAVRFLDNGAVGVDALNYQWSNDGGTTWTDATLAAGETRITMEGVSLDIRNGTEVTAATQTDNIYSNDGSFLYIHHTTQYNGDDNDRNTYGVTTGAPDGFNSTVVGTLNDNISFTLDAAADLNAPGSTVNYTINYRDGIPATTYTGTAIVPDPATGKIEIPFETAAGVPFLDANGNPVSIELDTTNSANGTLPANMNIDLQPRRVDIMANGTTDVLLNAQGTYPHNTLIRMETDADLGAPGSTFDYSYSTDAGNTWIKASGIVPDPATGSARLALPGGFLELSSPDLAAPITVTAGSQMVIHPDRASLEYEVMKDTYVQVNQVGKDIFGGQYNGQVVEGPNLFEVVGQLIAYCEFNDTDGIAETLETITAAHEHVETQNTRIGGLTNRLDLAENMLSSEKLEQQERLSYTEDIDLTELLNNLAKQELAYNTVLKSSSMIMQLNLSQFV